MHRESALTSPNPSCMMVKWRGDTIATDPIEVSVTRRARTVDAQQFYACLLKYIAEDIPEEHTILVVRSECRSVTTLM